MEKSVLFRLSESSLTNHSHFTKSQNLVDGMVRSGFEQVADWKTFFPIVGGGYVNRWVKIGLLSTSPNLFNKIPLLVRGASVVALGGEAAAFEVAHRGIVSVTQPSSQIPPTLWTWSGSHGLKEGWLHSVTNFGAIKVFGAWGEGQNLVFRHGAQALGMVAGHQLVYLAGWSEKPEGSFAEQIFQAEGVNLQLAGGMALFHVGAPGLHAMERGWDLALRARESGTNFSRPHFPEGETPLLQGAGKSPSSFGPKHSPSREGRAIDRHINLMVPVDGDGNGGAGKPGGETSSAHVLPPPWTPEVGRAKAVEFLKDKAPGEIKPMRDRITRAIERGTYWAQAAHPSESDWIRFEAYRLIAKDMGYEMGPLRRNERNGRIEASLDKIGEGSRDETSVFHSKAATPSERPPAPSEGSAPSHEPPPPPAPPASLVTPPWTVEEGRTIGRVLLQGTTDSFRTEMETDIRNSVEHGVLSFGVHRAPSLEPLLKSFEAYRIVAEKMGYEIGAPRLNPTSERLEAPIQKIGGSIQEAMALLLERTSAPSERRAEEGSIDPHKPAPPPTLEEGRRRGEETLANLALATGDGDYVRQQMETILHDAFGHGRMEWTINPHGPSSKDWDNIEAFRIVAEGLGYEIGSPKEFEFDPAASKARAPLRKIGEGPTTELREAPAPGDPWMAPVPPMGPHDTLQGYTHESLTLKLAPSVPPNMVTSRLGILGREIVIDVGMMPSDEILRIKGNASATEISYDLDLALLEGRKFHVLTIPTSAANIPGPINVYRKDPHKKPNIFTISNLGSLPIRIQSPGAWAFTTTHFLEDGGFRQGGLIEFGGQPLTIKGLPEVERSPYEFALDLSRDPEQAPVPEPPPEAPRAAISEPPVADRHAALPPPPSEPVGAPAPYRAPLPTLVIAEPVIRSADPDEGRATVPSPPRSAPAEAVKVERGRSPDEVLSGNDEDLWRPLGEAYLQASEAGYQSVWKMGARDVLANNLREAAKEGKLELTGNPTEPQRRESIAAYRVVAKELGVPLGEFVFYGSRGTLAGTHVATVGRPPSPPPPSSSHGDPWMAPVPAMELNETSQNFTPESLTLKLAPDVPPGLVVSQVGQYGREIVINVGEMPSNEVLEIEGNSLAGEISYEPHSSFVDGKNIHTLRIPSATRQGPLDISREDPQAKPHEFQISNVGSAPITLSLPEGRGGTIESLQTGLLEEGGTIAFGLQRLAIKGLPVPPKSTPSSSKREHAPSPSTPEDGRQIGEEFLASTQRAVLIGADPDAWVPLGEKFIREQEGNYRAAHGAGVKEILSRDLNEAGFLGQIRLVGDPKDLKTLELLAAYRVMAIELGIYLGDFTYHPPEGEKEGSFEAKISEIASADSVPPPKVEEDTTEKFVRKTTETKEAPTASPPSSWETIAEELVGEFGEGEKDDRISSGDRATVPRFPQKATVAMAVPPPDEISRGAPSDPAPPPPAEPPGKGVRWPLRLRKAFASFVPSLRPTSSEEPTLKAIAMTIRFTAPSLEIFARQQKDRITADGIFIKADKPYEPGTLIKFDIKIGEEETLLKGGGRVEWRRTPEEAGPDQPAGMWIKFLKLDQKNRDNLRRILARKS